MISMIWMGKGKIISFLLLTFSPPIACAALCTNMVLSAEPGLGVINFETC